MKQILCSLLVILTINLYGQDIPTIEYKYQGIKKGVLAGNINNLDKIKTYKVKFDYNGVVVNGKMIGVKGFVSEDNFIKEYAKVKNEKLPGSGSTLESDWKRGKEMFYPAEFMRIFSIESEKELSLIRVDSSEKADVDLIIRTTMMAPETGQTKYNAPAIIDVEYVFVSSSGEELLKIWLKNIYLMKTAFTASTTSFDFISAYNQAAHKLTNFLKEQRKEVAEQTK